MKPRLMLLRLALSLLSGLIITGMCLKLINVSTLLRYPQTKTQRDIQRTSKAIAVYRQKTGALPTTLQRIGEVPAAEFSTGGSPIWRDSFGHPFIYRVQGQKYQLISLRADGKSGGIGFDCDLSNDNLKPPQAEIPLWQLLAQPLSQGLLVSSLVCGGLVALFTFLELSGKSLERTQWLKTAIRLFLLLVAASLVSTIITSVHVPSGH